MKDDAQGTRFPAFGGDGLAWVGIIGPGVCRESGRFESVLEDIEQRGFKTVVIDLAECPRMDSTFAGALLRLAQRAGARGPGCGLRVILNRPSEEVRDLVDTLYLEPQLEVADLAAPESLPDLPVEARERSVEEIMALSYDGHQRLAALGPKNQQRFAGYLAVLGEQIAARKRPAGGPCPETAATS